MQDEALEILRRVMVDRALDLGDRDTFMRLTDSDWSVYIVSGTESQVDDKETLNFLTEDPHFWDRRVIALSSRQTYLNYRFRDYMGGLMYVGEIRVPIGWKGAVESRFRPRPADGRMAQPPQWFDSLLKKVIHSLQ